MIIEIFSAFLGLALILSVIGYYIESEIMLIFGFLMFSLLSFPLINGELEFKTGAAIESNYTYTADKLTAGTNTIEYSYEVYEDTWWYGLFLLFIGFSGMFMWYRGYRYDKRSDD